MKNTSLLFGVLINCVIGLLIASSCNAAGINADPTLCMAGVNFAGYIMHVVKQQSNVVLFDGLAQEVWLPDVMEDFYPSNSFLTAARDLSSLVDNDKINFAEAGADPSVMKNNNVYPVGANVASDTPKEIALDYYDTDSSIVRNAVAVELAYDQRQLYTKKHQKALLKRLGMDAAYAYAPASNTANTPVLSLGAGDSIIDAIIDLQRQYNEFDDDGTDRALVLCPRHLAKIQKEDKQLYKALMAKPGEIYYDFKIFKYSKNPIYVSATNTKAAFGAAYVDGTHKFGSFSFMGSEVMKAQGTFKMFSTLNDPAQKGDVFNFQMRALVSSMRGKYSGAILQA
jgi:hypothetical protein